MTQQPGPPHGEQGRDPRGDEPGIELGKPRPGAQQPLPAYPPPPPTGGWSSPPPPTGQPAPPQYGSGWGSQGQQGAQQPQQGGWQQPGAYPPPQQGGWQQPGAYPPPQPWQGHPGSLGQGSSRLTASEERTWASAAHWSALIASLVVLAFLGPLIVLLVKGNDSPFVRRQAVESLNFQLTILIAAVVSAVLLFVVVGLLLLPLVGLAWLVFTIIGAVKASSGEDYRYPFSLRMVR